MSFWVDCVRRRPPSPFGVASTAMAAVDASGFLA